MNAATDTAIGTSTTTSKRPRIVVKSHEIAHLWAHQTQPEAKCGRNMSFKGTSFYSYSTEIATIVENRKGERAYIVSNSTYSVSTSSHQSDVRQAIPSGETVFMVPGIKARWGGSTWLSSYTSGSGGINYGDLADPRRICAAWKDEIAGKLKESAGAREPKKSRLILEADDVLREMRRLAAFFQVASKVVFPKLPISGERVAEMRQAVSDKVVAKRVVEEQKRERERLAWIAAEPERQLAYDRWLMGGPRFNGIYQFPTALRVVGDVVETSRGASFPIEHARRGLQLVESVRARGEAWQRNGHTCHLGHYQIDGVDADGTVHAGCHVVGYEAIERVAEEIRRGGDPIGVQL